MEIEFFTDILFDLLNESDLLDAQELTAERSAGTLTITVGDGTKFRVCAAKQSGNFSSFHGEGEKSTIHP